MKFRTINWLYKSTEHNISILSIESNNQECLNVIRDIVLVIDDSVSRLSSCSVIGADPLTYHPTKLQYPMIQVCGNINDMSWYDGYGATALSLIRRKNNITYTFDLMKDLHQDEKMGNFRHQTPVHLWYDNENEINVLTVIWDVEGERRPMLLYRRFMIHCKKLRKIKTKELQLYQIMRVYHGGVQQSKTMYWNVDPINKDFPITLGQEAKKIIPCTYMKVPPVAIDIPSQPSDSSLIFICMEGSFAKYLQLLPIEADPNLRIVRYPTKNLKTIKICIEKWKWMTLRPPHTLEMEYDEKDFGGYAYRKCAERFAQYFNEDSM